MEELIKQAFQSIEVIGPLVQRGMFDLIGPNGEIILPQVWDKVIEPDWQITMVMWPPADRAKLPPDHPHFRLGGKVPHRPGMPMPPPSMMGRRQSGLGPPPPPPGWQGAPPRPPGRSNIPVGVDIVNVEKEKKSKKSSGGGAFLGWVSGTQPKKGGKKYAYPPPNPFIDKLPPPL